MNECIHEEVYTKPGFTEFLTPYEGIVADKQIVFLGRINGLVGQGHDDSNCAPVENTAGVTNTEKFWRPKQWDDRFSECWDDLMETFFRYSLKPGTDIGDLTTTDFAEFFEARYADELAEMFFRFVWFGDEDAATIADSPAGYFITSGFEAKRWNVIDGLWKQLFAIVASDSTRRTTGAGLDTRNSQGTFAAQAFTSADTTAKVVTNTLQNMEFESDYRLRDKGERFYIATQSVVDQYKRELEDYAGSGIETSFDILQNGITVLKRGGVTIYGFSFWDRMIRTYMRNSTGLGYYYPHRILLTTKEQLAVGTREMGVFSKVKPFYDDVTNKSYFDIAGNIDAKVLQDFMVQVAY